MLNSPKIDVKEYAIGGKLISVRCAISDMDMFNDDPLFKDSVKMKLAGELARYMVENGLVEFNKTHVYSQHSTVVIARAYVAPNEQVKIIRSINGA